MAKKRNYKTNPPEKLTELNKDSMLDYVVSLGDDDVALFIDLLDNNTEEKKNSLPTIQGDTVKGYNIPVIRKEFAKRYFPQLLVKKTQKPKDSFEERVKQLRNKVNK